MENEQWLDGVLARCNSDPRICPCNRLTEKEQIDWFAGWDFADVLIDLGVNSPTRIEKTVVILQ